MLKLGPWRTLTSFNQSNAGVSPTTTMRNAGGLGCEKIHSSHSERGHSTLSLLVNKFASEVYVNYIICCTDPRKISIGLRKKSHHRIQRRGLKILKLKWELAQKFFSNIFSTAAKFLTVSFLDLIKLRTHLQEKRGHTHKNNNCIICA